MVKVPVLGSYSSAEDTACTSETPMPPPAMRTRPSFSSVAVWPYRGDRSRPVGMNLPIFGSYSSASLMGLLLYRPPATRTRPSASSVAVPMLRPFSIEPVGAKVPRGWLGD